MTTITASKQAIASAEDIIASWNGQSAKEQNVNIGVILNATQEPAVLAAMAVRASDRAGEFPDLYSALAEKGGDELARGYAVAVYHLDQIRRCDGRKPLPVRFDDRGGLNVIDFAEWKSQQAIA